MRTTLNIDDQLLAEAQRITGISEKTALVREGLRAATWVWPMTREDRLLFLPHPPAVYSRAG